MPRIVNTSLAGLHEFNTDSVRVGNEDQFYRHWALSNLRSSALNNSASALNKASDLGVEIIDIDRKMCEPKLVPRHRRRAVYAGGAVVEKLKLESVSLDEMGGEIHFTANLKSIGPFPADRRHHRGFEAHAVTPEPK